ncbi:ArsB/NhaD family transporter [Nocardia beijingensis]|uniref:SLC13 family permease n=1 Tax=Nocardia beijingensis TaxID=95162 RepID=UPI00226BC3BA|nr:ArsB/NhaD family transporter [Nocardia beijingensis]
MRCKAADPSPRLEHPLGDLPVVEVMTVIAVVVFLAAYVLIATERIHKTKAALGGAAIVLALGVVGSEDAFYSREVGIDWDVIFLLLGMMIIVGVLRQTGVFEYTAIWAAKRARGSALRVMVLLVLITALASAFLDNVTTVLLIAPVTLLVCDRLAINPVPFLIAEVLASNIGGAATLIGDPPNIIIGSRAGLSFNTFLVNMAPIVLIALAVFTLLLPRLFRGSFDVDPARAADVMSLDESEAIRDRRLLIKCAIVLAAVFAGFVGHSLFHIAPSVVALLGAGVLVLISGVPQSDYLSAVEWETLLFFVGLFVMIGALVHTGVIERLAELATEATGGNALVATMLILVVSALLSGVIDNIPYVATMSPLVADLVTSIDHSQAGALWWSLALGADFGGNLTAVGASANVVMLGIARRADHPISFWEFTRKGTVVTAITVAVAAPYLWLRYFVLG